MKNIAIIIYSLKGGGAERVVSLLSQELSKKNNLYLIVFDSEDIAYPYGGKLIDLNIKSNSNVFLKIINVIRRVNSVRKVKKQCNIHCSISFLDSANIINILSRRGDKVIISIRSHLSKGKKDRSTYVIRCLNKYLYNKADRIIAVSNGVAIDLINKHKLKKELVNYIYNPIDIKKVNELSLELLSNNNLFSNDFFTLINVGRLTNAKGQWHLIRAISHVKKEIKNIKLIILGQGELENYLKDLVKKLDLNDNVSFLGFQNNPFKYIKKSDLFVFSSLYEGFANVLIEAMACGTPIISTDCRSGPREILAPRTDVEYETKNIEYCEYGVLVPVCNGIQYDYDSPLTEEEKLLAKSIIQLYNDERLRRQYSDKVIERVKEFDINNIVKEWMELISDNNV